MRQFYAVDVLVTRKEVHFVRTDSKKKAEKRVKANIKSDCKCSNNKTLVKVKTIKVEGEFDGKS